MKTSELTGAALDYAVAMCEGLRPEEIHISGSGQWRQLFRNNYDDDGALDGSYTTGPGLLFSTKWQAGGLIIERERITLVCCKDDYETDSRGFTTNKRIPVWAAEQGGQHSAQTRYEGQCYEPQYEISKSSCVYGITPLIAAMRCYVASKLGSEVDIPEQLCK